MSKVTKSHVYSAFIMLANRLGKSVYIDASTLQGLRKNNPYFNEPKNLVEKYQTIGSWSLANGYHGWSIEEMHNESGGISHPISSNSLKSAQFYDAVYFALGVLRHKELSDAK